MPKTLETRIREFIALICAGENGIYQNKGTAFLISNNENQQYVLTAFHVVVREEDYNSLVSRDTQSIDNNDIFISPIELNFKEFNIKCNAEVVENSWNIYQDWVLLKITEINNTNLKIIKNTNLLPLGELTESNKNKDWETFGFPKVTEYNNFTAKGTITALESRNSKGEKNYQLFCDQAAAGQGTLFTGYSGAPCIVNGVVVGILVRAATDNNYAICGTLYACPIISLLERKQYLPAEVLEQLMGRHNEDEHINLALPIDLINELADLYSTVDDAKALWRRAKGKARDVPDMKNPADLWQKLWDKSAGGASATPKKLLEAALEEYPHNQIFKRYLEILNKN